MAAIFNPAIANSPQLSSRTSARLVAGLAPLVIGVAVLLGSAVPPDVQVHPVVAPVAAAIPAAGGLDAAWHDADRAPRSPSRLIPTVDRSRADRHSLAVMSLDRTRVELETALARGTRAEPDPLATIPLQPDGWDVRWGLMEMAAAQHRNWILSCPCPVDSVDGPNSGPR